jgi:uncharacterized protein (DUF4415 family)
VRRTYRYVATTKDERNAAEGCFSGACQETGWYMSKKSEMLEEYDFSKGKRGPVISNKGKTRITIFIDSDILEWFRDEAKREGRGYQTAINQALRNYIKQDRRPIQDIVKEVVRKELRILKKAS